MGRLERDANTGGEVHGSALEMLGSVGGGGGMGTVPSGCWRGCRAWAARNLLKMHVWCAYTSTTLRSRCSQSERPAAARPAQAGKGMRRVGLWWQWQRWVSGAAIVPGQPEGAISAQSLPWRLPPCRPGTWHGRWGPPAPCTVPQEPWRGGLRRAGRWARGSNEGSGSKTNNGSGKARATAARAEAAVERCPPQRARGGERRRRRRRQSRQRWERCRAPPWPPVGVGSLMQRASRPPTLSRGRAGWERQQQQPLRPALTS